MFDTYLSKVYEKLISYPTMQNVKKGRWYHVFGLGCLVMKFSIEHIVNIWN